MARIPEYEGPDRQISASDKGASAFEQAGRRIGPAYNEAATLQRQAGEAQAAIIRQRRWPFDMLELQRSLEETGKGTSTASGYGVKVSGDINHLEHEKEGGGSGPGKSNSRSRLGNDVGATSMAAGALGKLASRLGSTGQYHNSNIDPATGLDMNLLAPTTTKVLENGILVDKNKAGAVDKYDINGANGAQAFNDAFQSGKFNDPKVAKAFSDKYGYDPNTGRMVDSSSYTGGNTPDGAGTSSSGDQILRGSSSPGASSPSGTDAFSPDSSVVPTATGSAPRDFWSDITSSLGNALNTSGGQDYGGGQDTGGYADLTGEGAQ